MPGLIRQASSHLMAKIPHAFASTQFMVWVDYTGCGLFWRQCLVLKSLSEDEVSNDTLNAFYSFAFDDFSESLCNLY